jgi:predicted AlkP superfamily phosphohydrolase/phosphomutase
MITRREFVIQSILLSLGLTAFSGCTDFSTKGKPVNKKAIVLGIDGFDYVIMQRLMKAGKLPNFAGLAQSGCFSALATSNPPQSPVAWSSIATGKNPGKHGVFDFIIRHPRKYLPDLGVLRMKKGGMQLTGPSFEPPRKAMAFWEILAEADIPSTVVKWPMTFPPAKVSSRILAGLGVPDIKGGLGKYAFYTTEEIAKNEEGHEKVVPVKISGGRIETEIEGPMVSGLTGKKPARVPFTFNLDKGRKLGVLEIQGVKVEIRERGWSPWVSVKFDVGFFQHVQGLCKFYLQSIEPAFALYMTPIQVDPSDPCFPISQPENYATELAEQFGPYYTLGIPEDTKALTENRLSDEGFIEMCDQIVSEQEAMLWYELERFKHGLLAFAFFTTDRIQHIFWATQDPTHPAYNDSYAVKYGGIMESYYKRLDRVLGKVVKHVDDRTLLMVFSDHGFTSFRKAVHLNTWLVRNGFMALKEKPDVSDREGGPLFKYVDWKRTRAYALGLGSIYINLDGREGQGVVSQKEYPEVVRSVQARLENFVDPDTGVPVAKSVYARDDIYHGEFVTEAADLVVGFNDGFRMSWQTAIGGTPLKLMEDNVQKWTGDHCVDPSLVPGILFMNQKLKKESPSVLDVAPAVLKYFGLSADMDGVSFI